MPIAVLGFLNIFSGLGPWLAANWKYVLVGLLAFGLIFITHEWQHTSQLLKTEKAAHAADIKAYKDASALAQQKVDAEKAELAKENQEAASAADKNYSALLVTYHANLLRYSASQGVRSGPSGGQPDSTPQSVDGPSKGPVVSSALVISADDANTCAINTARLQAAHDWALTLPGVTNASK
jgi:hypothetical protein